jgi:ParB-like nuclease domain
VSAMARGRTSAPPSSGPSVLPIGALTPNPWNPNRMNAFMFAKALESIKTYGFQDPITVRRTPDGIQIIDGEHRWQAAKQLGYSEVPVWFLPDIDDDTAKKLTVVFNELKGQSRPQDVAVLLKDILERTTIEELLVGLPYTDEILRGFIGMGDLELPSAPPPKVGIIPPKEPWVERTYRMPKSVAVVLDEAIAKATASDEVEPWQALERIAADFMAG